MEADKKTSKNDYFFGRFFYIYSISLSLDISEGLL